MSEELWARPLEITDADFTKVPEAEEAACAHYEYARESQTIIFRVQKLRKPRPSALSLDEALEHENPTFYSILSQTKTFPASNWVSLSSGIKEQLKRFAPEPIFYQSLFFQTLNPGKGFPNCSREEFLERAGMDNESTVMIFAFPPSLDSKKKILYFLNRHFEGVPKKRRPRDWLNALTVLRLDFLFPKYKDALEQYDKMHLHVKFANYADQGTWSYARNSAITHFRKLHSLPPEEIPLHSRSL